MDSSRSRRARALGAGVMRRLAGDECGLAMITVIGIGAILAGMTALLVVQGVSNLSGVREQRTREQSLQIADSAIDDTLYRLNLLQTYTTGETAPAFATKAQESAWVIAQAKAAAATRLKRVPGGEWVAIRPSNLKVAYGVGFVPTRSNPISTRAIRVEYDFGAITLDYAILSGDDLRVPDRLDVVSGSVHTNGDLIANTGASCPQSSGVCYSGSWATVDGAISASGAFGVNSKIKYGDAENSGGGKPPVLIPDLDPRAFWPLAQYALCPGGRIRPGPALDVNSGNNPCTGSIMATISGNQTYRGWRYLGVQGNKGSLWDYAGKKRFDGVYYIHQGSALLLNKPENNWKVTIMAEASGSCPQGGVGSQVGGDIEVRTGKQGPGEAAGQVWQKGEYYPTAQPFLMMAGRDFIMSSGHAHDLVGAISAREQFVVGPRHLELRGTLLGSNICDTTGTYGSGSANNSITGRSYVAYTRFDEIPIDRVRVTQWQEL